MPQYATHLSPRTQRVVRQYDGQQILLLPGPQNDSFKASPLARGRGLFVPVKQERILGRPSYYLEGLPVGVLLECVGYSQDHRIVEVFAYYHQTNG